ncbi:thiamine pyrophosphate-dependent dehydrogenase E1 component subunit alpha [Gordonia sp. LSe1-13]|uniref:Thiamine pyrophosphate-dependent dehydrogenase E1 component subunit alpha n=1 Tax=Gordonia sesuvii TaxID=3116777 RepID=A0ABU7MIS4_9ACTN|nr:thiamine pyrophosphate-dependent dehydrogenase E1 component subunit alpha [Gordonia sp. LSe1-13]
MSGLDSADVAAEHYRGMLMCRRFEETVHEQHDLGNVPGPLHLSIGQEAVAVGVCSSLTDTDVITSTHRGHHHCVAKGADLGRLMAELLGRRDGYSRGRNGSMHLADTSVGLLGTNGIVGGGIPIAVGAAFALQLRGSNDVAVCFFGDGATATGNFAEAMNIAGLWKLPIVFVCENNQFAEMTPTSVHVAGQLWRRADAHDFPGMRVQGTEVEIVADAAAAAIARARAGHGPTLLEVMTYRLSGHFVGDPSNRDSAMADRWRKRDPLTTARRVLPESQAAQIESEVEAAIQDALSRALKSEPVSVGDIA